MNDQRRDMPSAAARPIENRTVSGSGSRPVRPAGASGTTANRAVRPVGASGTTANRPVRPAGASGTTANRPARPAGASGTTANRPARPAGASGTTANRPVRPAGASGTTANRPVRPAGASGTTANRPVRPAGASGTTANRPVRPAGASGTTANRPVRPAGASGTTANRPVRPAGASGTTANRPVRPAGASGTTANRPVRPAGAYANKNAVRRNAVNQNSGRTFADIFRSAMTAAAGFFRGIFKKFSAFKARVLEWQRTREKSKIEKRIEKWIGKNEAKRIVFHSILGAVVVCVLLGIFAACKPSIDNARARMLAKQGNAEESLRIVRRLAAEGYSEEELENTKRAVLSGLIKNGKFQEAYALQEELPKDAEAEELRQSIRYNEAISFYEQGKYSAAAQVFYQMNDYENSAGYYADCRCALAVQAYLEGNEKSAYSLLLDVPEVAERIKTAAYAVAADEAQARQILSAEMFQTERLNMMEQTMEGLNAARSDMPNGRIAAGARHTLGLSSGGTVYAAGDNSFGQLNVSQWSGVTQVAAGAYHSVALFADGTVAAVGDNSQGQCDVSAWTDVVAIAASAYDTIALKSDGTVVACGMHAQEVSGWRDVTHITGGSYSMGCIYNKGAMLSSHGAAQMDMGIVLYDLAVCGPVSAGILYDGTLVSTYEKAPEWGELVSVTVSETCILAIDVNGQVRSYFYRAGDAVNIAVSAKAVEAASSGTHHAVLTEDGRVECFGNNDYGQCNTADWRL